MIEYVIENIPAFATILGLIISTATFAVKLIKALKEKNLAKAKTILYDAANSAVQLVESVKNKAGGDLNGEVKKSMALVYINQACIEQGIKYDPEAASNLIEEIITLSKNVNAPK